MTDSLKDFLSSKKKQKFATDAGNDKHAKMQRIIIDTDIEKGDKELITKLKSCPNLLPYFTRKSRVEVPIAGKIDNKVVSRRIDRMLVDHENKTVVFIDYKTDVNKNTFRDRYSKQMNEYSKLLKNIYPDYSINGFILWLHDFTTEQIS